MNSRTRRAGRIPLVGVMALALALAAAPVAADVDAVDAGLQTSSAAANAARVMAFQTVVCADYGSVRGNRAGSGPDDTARDSADVGAPVEDRELPIELLPSAPDGCHFEPDVVDFRLTLGSDEFVLSDDTEGLHRDDHLGVSRITTGAFFDPSRGVGELNLEIRAIVPQETLFGALQCYDDARNADNLEIISVPPNLEGGGFVCVLFLVDDAADTGSGEETGGESGDESDDQAPPAGSPPAVITPDTQVLGDQQVVQERNGQTVMASGPATGDIRIAFGPDEDLATDAAVIAACDVLVDEVDGLVRQAPNVVVIDPTGFAPGDEIEVSTLIPAAAVQQAADWSTVPTGDLQVGETDADVAFVTPEQILERLQQIRTNRGLPAEPDSDALWVERILAGTATIGDARTAISAKAAYWSADAHGVCFAGEKSEVGSLTGLPPLQGTALFGPVLLGPCTEETGAPCIDARTGDDDGNVIIDYRIPAEDPWMR